MANTPNINYKADKINALLGFVDKQFAAENQTKANALLTVSSTGGTTFYTDTTLPANRTSKVTHTLRYNGTLVDANSTPNGWTKENTGVYTATLTDSNRTLTGPTFNYDVKEGDYAGITAVKAGATKSISVVNPAWYGFSTSNNANDIATVIGSLTRITSNYSASKITNNSSSNGYFWMVTKNSATIKEMGLDANQAPVTKNFTSPSNSAITCESYKVYITTGQYPVGDSNLTVNITL